MPANTVDNQECFQGCTPEAGIRVRRKREFRGLQIALFLNGSQGTPFSLQELEKGLRLADPDYSIEFYGEDETGDFGLLLHNGIECGPVEINWAGNIFESELEEHRLNVKASRAPNRNQVLNVLNETDALFVIQVLLGRVGEEIDVTFGRIDPIFGWLSENRKGLTYAELEGFYDGNELIFKERIRS